ncbi:MAG TPA: RDD family protein [Polyangiales bacterium]
MSAADLHLIRTPENVVFEFELAGLASRALSWIIDLGAMAGLYAAAMLVAGTAGVVFSGLAAAMYFVLAFLIQWGYGAVLEWKWHGQTLGKRVVGLRVLQDSGTPITFVQAAIRNLVRIVDILPGTYLTGGVTALLDRRGRRLGDIAAGTVVVRRRRSPRPSAVMAPVDRYNSFENDPSVAHAATLITPPERDAMIGLAMRRDSLPLPVRYSLFAKLAAHLERRLRIERPDYFSEERFVLNLTAIALRPREQRSSPSSELHSPPAAASTSRDPRPR